MANYGRSSFIFCPTCATEIPDASSEGVEHPHFRECWERWVTTPRGRAMTQFFDDINQSLEQQRQQTGESSNAQVTAPGQKKVNQNKEEEEKGITHHNHIMSEEVPAFKKQKLLLVSEDEEEDQHDQQKLLYYILAYFGDEEQYTIGYNMYRIDLSQFGDDVGPMPMPDPVLHLEADKYPRGASFGALGSMIYMVGGTKYIKEGIMDCIGGRKVRVHFVDNQDVYIIDTSLDVPSVTSGPPLGSPVASKPIVIPLHGKLHVMPSGSFLGGEDCDRSVMQVLDPVANNSWSVVEFPCEMWETVRLNEYYNLGIESYAVRGSKIALSLKLSSSSTGHKFGVFVYDTEESKWDVVRKLSSEMALIPVVGGCYTWDSDDIWCSMICGKGVLRLHDATLGRRKWNLGHEEDFGEIYFSLSDIRCGGENKHIRGRPYWEDGCVIELEPGYILVVSQLWWLPFVPKKCDFERYVSNGSFELRFHFLKLHFERSRKYSKARIAKTEVLKCGSLTKSRKHMNTGVIRGLEQMIDNHSACFFI